MYLVKEDAPRWFGDNPSAGKIDEISSRLPVNASVEVRLSNSKTNKLGPVILQSTLYGCHK
ncbi:hypothetical protein AB7942_25220 [Neobacillus sp. BF23-41]|uniref:hypothetical protein n=1 Tax=Neobacillus sp. BF23-41 TaxID=3240280 RepID=UPI0034E53DEC